MNAPELRLPPFSIESEQALIGGLILAPKAWDKVADIVSAEDFYRDDHRRIFRHIAILAGAGKGYDVVSLFDEIERSNEVEQTGGLGFLGELANNSPGPATIRRHAEIVREKARLRKLITVGDEFVAACMRPGKRTAADLVEEVERRLAEENDPGTEEPGLLVDVFNDALNYIDSRGSTAGLKIGFDEFDNLTGGLEPGQLVVIAARPSVGKTLFACNAADNVATSGKAVLFQTMEMSRREIGMRILAARSRVSVHAMRAGTKDHQAWDRMYSTLPGVEKHRFWIDDRPAVSVGYVRARARRMQRQKGLDLIVIDYLGLMTGEGDNRVQQIGSISRGLKALAKELQIPIIVLAQLNRSVEGRAGDKRPMMSDLRDSGEIEQDADIIGMLHRESLYSDAAHWADFAELILRKNRQGPLGECCLHYDGRLMTFTPWQGPSPRTLAKPKNPEFKD